MRGRLLFIGAVILIAVGALMLSMRPRSGRRLLTPDGPSTAPATMPATSTAPSSGPATRAVIDSYSSFIAAVDPRFKNVEEARSPLPFDASSQITWDRPVLLDRRGDLWITHPDAPPIREVLKTAGKDQTHITCDTVEFVYWSRDQRGNWVAQPVTRDGETFTWHGRERDTRLERPDYLFRSAVLLRDDRIIVPTRAGVSTLIPPLLPYVPTGGRQSTSVPATQDITPQESFQEIEGRTPVTVFAVMNSAVALRPWDNGNLGSDLAYLHVAGGGRSAGSWQALGADEGVPPQLVHLFALTDGSTLALSMGEDAGLILTTLPPRTPPDADRDRKVAELVEKLNDARGKVRGEAAADLARYGPSAWPTMERLRGSQTPEAQQAIDKLLGLRARPAMGIFQLLPGPVRLVTRSEDGALALYTYGGVSYYEDGEDRIASTALLIAMPGRSTLLAHPAVLKDRKPENLRLQLRAGELLVEDDAKGPLRLLGNHLSAMLKPETKRFIRWVGTDRRSRWIFSTADHAETLIVDTNLQDPTPRLPAWTMEFEDGQTGWDKDNRLVIQRNKNPWRLLKGGWDALDTNSAEVFMDKALPTTAPVSSSLLHGTDPLQLLAGPSAVASFGGEGAPPPVAILRVSPDRAFFFDRPGRVLRLSKGPDGKFETDATFTHDIPSTGVRRIWLDPDGRICIVHDRNKAVVLFPEGRVPPELVTLVRNAK